MKARTLLLPALVALLAVPTAAESQRRSGGSDLDALNRQVEELQREMSGLREVVDDLRQDRRLLRRELEVVKTELAAATQQVGFTDTGSSLVVEYGGSRFELGGGGINLEGSAIDIGAQTGLDLTSAATVHVAGAQVDVAGGVVNLNSDIVTVEDLIQAPTMVANTVDANTYTAGAGNIW